MKTNTQLINKEDIKKKYSRTISELSPFNIGIPLIDISDKTIEEIYYYRWHTFCSHIKPIPEGFVITEFLPDVPWAGKYNTIPCAAGHHFYEGRWLHEQNYINSYAKFWFSKEAAPRNYSVWLADALFSTAKITGDFTTLTSLYNNLKENLSLWQKEKQTENGLFFQIDDRDGMEFSAGGSGCRPTINSYMYGELIALGKLAAYINNFHESNYFFTKANELKNKINIMLWDNNSGFFKTLNIDNNKLTDVKELIGYIPWYFNIPDDNKTEAWKYLNDEKYFFAPYGPTTTEQNYADFMRTNEHECLWNGPSWPFATSQTLTALGNLLCNYNQSLMKKSDYYNLLHLYANSQYLDENGKRQPFIDENLDPFTGKWIARELLKNNNKPDKGPKNRGEHYNHSTFCDLVLNGLAGIRGVENGSIVVNPLFDEENLSYFCVDDVICNGYKLSIVWDKTGERYGIGKGYKIFINDNMVFSNINLCKFVYLLK